MKNGCLRQGGGSKPIMKRKPSVKLNNFRFEMNIFQINNESVRRRSLIGRRLLEGNQNKISIAKMVANESRGFELDYNIETILELI